MAQFIIREGTSVDCDAIYALICDMERTELSYKVFRSAYFQQLVSPRYECLVYEQKGTVVGVINIRYEDQLHHAARIAEIMECVVDGSARSEGIGARLMDRACEHARMRGCVQIEVACNQLSTRAHRFYEREDMNNFCFKFSKPLTQIRVTQNAIGC